LNLNLLLLKKYEQNAEVDQNISYYFLLIDYFFANFELFIL